MAVPAGIKRIIPFSEATFKAPAAAAFTPASVPVFKARPTVSSTSMPSPSITCAASEKPVVIAAACKPIIPAFFPICNAKSFV